MQVKKALRQARAARTVAIIIGGFLACWTPYIIIIIISSSSSSTDRWTPYTITTIVTVTTGENHSYATNFTVIFLAFASGFVFIPAASFSSRCLVDFHVARCANLISATILVFIPIASFSSQESRFRQRSGRSNRLRCRQS